MVEDLTISELRALVEALQGPGVHCRNPKVLFRARRKLIDELENEEATSKARREEMRAAKKRAADYQIANMEPIARTKPTRESYSGANAAVRADIARRRAALEKKGGG